MLRPVLSLAMVTLIALLACSSLVAGVPLQLTHQGRLLDPSDVPLDGIFTIVYSIHDAPTGGSQLWLEDHVGVQVTDGLFTVQLGSTVPLTTDILTGSGGGGGGGFSVVRYLQIQLSGQPPIMPRTQLVSSPYAVASHSVSGDIETFAGGFKTRCQGCNDPWRGDISAASVVGADSFTVVRLNGLPPGTPVTGRTGMAVTDDVSSVWLGDIDSDGLMDMRCEPDSTVFDMVTSDNGDEVSSYRAKTGKTGATKRMSVTNPISNTLEEITEVCGDSAGPSLTIRLDPTPMRLSTNLTIARQTLRASSTASCDTDGDGIPESEASHSVTPTTSNVAIKTKGTGADPNRVLSIQLGADPTVVSGMMSVDDDGDTVPESEISHSVTPTTSSVAIKVKGTGADRDRRVGSQCDDSSAVHYLDVDDDGDGHAEARGIISVKAGTGSGSLSASVSNQMTCDSDDDGVPDSEISQSVTPTTSNVAIKTKGTGADADRVLSIQSGATPDALSSVSSIDDDGDTVPESEIDQFVTPTTCGVAIKTKGTGADNNRTISNSCDDSAAVQTLEVDEDGDGTSNTTITVRAQDAFGNMVISSDSDDDGVSDFSSEARAGTVAVSYTLFDTSGDPSSIDFTVGNDKPQITVSQMGINRCLISPDSGIQLSNSSNVKTVDLHDSGILYLAGGMEIGMTGGTHHIDVAGGAYCDGTNWVNASDKNSKENFEKVDGGELLDKIAGLDITKWNYKSDKETEHIGPTAQDFKKAFGVGSDSKSISTIDPSGIALAAIKALYAQLKSKDKEMDEQLKIRDKQIQELQKQLEKVQNLLKKN